MRGMTGRFPKRPRDPNQLAKMIVDIATGESGEQADSPTSDRARKAGVVGGPARARVLSPERRKQIASKAALARWAKESVEGD